MRCARSFGTLFVSVFVAGGVHAASQSYFATELTQFEGAYSAFLGEQGQVVGSQPSNRPIQWSPTSGMQYLPLYGGTQYMQPRGVSKDGVILANSNGNTIMFAINPDFSYSAYPWTGGGFTNVYPGSRNRAGALIFRLWTGQDTVYYLANSPQSTPIMLPAPAGALNDAGECIMVGQRRKVNGTVQNLPAPPGMQAGGSALNESGYILGGYHETNSMVNTLCLWGPNNQVLATAALADASDGLGASFSFLNDQNEAVGTTGIGGVRKAAKWTMAYGLEDLNALVTNLPSSTTLTYGYGINNSGQILCRGTKNGQNVWVYLQPVPEPGTWLALGFGVGALGARRRRR